MSKSIKKLMLESANEISELELKKSLNEEYDKERLDEAYVLFEETNLKDVLVYPSFIVKNDISSSGDLNESVKVVTEAFLTKKGKDYISFLEFKDGVPEQNFIVQSTTSSIVSHEDFTHSIEC